jgi:hypothetical protein
MRAPQFETFEAYCRDRWEFSKSYASRLIGAAVVVENVSHGRQIKAIESIGERHARELARLPAEEQPMAWAEAVKTAPVGHVTAKHVAATQGDR